MDVAETKGRKFIFAIHVPLKIRAWGLALICRQCLCVMAKRLRDVCTSQGAQQRVCDWRAMALGL
jgi:hypothetical protein